MSTSLYIAVTYHGFGHIAQTGPVVNELSSRIAGLRVIIESAAPREVLARHFHTAFEHIRAASDFGMVMRDSLDVRVAESHAQYTRLHARWEEEVAAAMARLRACEPQLVLANVPYIPLVAAQRSRIPATAFCSLNWADIYLPFCRRLSGAERVYAQMLDGYRSARVFITPAPSMAMPALTNTVAVGPIARCGRSCRELLLEQLHLPPQQRLVAVFMGGVPTELGLERWPRIDGITWLVGGADCPARADMVLLTSLKLSYIDVVCSCDALITKPGYGGFAEAACNAIPVLYVPRDNWPEAPFLVCWLAEHGRCLELKREQLLNGDVMASLEALWRLPARPAVSPDGIAQAADILEPYLRR